MQGRLKNVAANVGLLLGSLLISVVATELVLRFAYPRYESAAEAQLDTDTMRIWATRPNRRSTLPHPDTGVRHEVIYNELALRQSRNFGALDATTNVAFFGDSYTVNVAMPSPYSFTEPLDYLLNESDGGGGINVLNFGVNGYGTDQAYLNYLSSELKGDLDYVFYLLCANDLRNVFETGLFSLDANGELVRNPVAKSPFWIRFISRLHVTYLALDMRQRILYSRTGGLDAYRQGFEQSGMDRERAERQHSPRADALEADLLAGVASEDVTKTVAVFKELIERWRASVESNGGKFYVVLLPTGREERFKDLIPSNVDVISLYDAFKGADPAFEYAAIRFANDAHWNEKGNELAARHLYPLLAREMGLPVMDEQAIRAALATYYAAFEPSAAAGTAEAAAATAIRNKYIELELATPSGATRGTNEPASQPAK